VAQSYGHVSLKMALNAHSTCTFARLGRLVGNTMTNVSPSNLKLVGRSTHLVLLHVAAAGAAGVEYSHANAVLCDAIDFVNAQGLEGTVSEVAISIVRILEVWRRKVNVDWLAAISALNASGSLEAYLQAYAKSGA